MTKARVIAATGLWMALLIAARPALAVDYYVDSDAGDDASDGSLEAPWETLRNLSRAASGDTVYFKTGVRWETELTLSTVSGVTYAAYGDGSTPPVIRSTATNVVSVHGSGVVLSGLRLEGSSNAAVLLLGPDNRLEGCEIVDAGMGVMVIGDGNVVTRNTIRDLNMVANDGVYQDYGAEGVMVTGSNTEISYNRLINCQAQSEYFGEDGGAVEIVAEDGTVVSDVRVHHNYVENSVGFFQAASYSSATIRDVVCAYNVVVDSRWVALLWSDAIHFEGVRFENNTVVWPAGASSPMVAKLFAGWASGGGIGSVPAGAVRFQNNLFAGLDGSLSLLGVGVERDHNLYGFPPEVAWSFEPGPTEILTADPGFVDLAAGDLHLLEGSPAIDAAIDLGYTHDFDDLAIPAGSAPDIGAYEFGSVDASGEPHIPEANSTRVVAPTGARGGGCTIAGRPALRLDLALLGLLGCLRRRRRERR